MHLSVIRLFNRPAAETPPEDGLLAFSVNINTGSLYGVTRVVLAASDTDERLTFLYSPGEKLTSNQIDFPSAAAIARLNQQEKVKR